MPPRRGHSSPVRPARARRAVSSSDEERERDDEVVYAARDEVDYLSGSLQRWIAATIERRHRDGTYCIRTVKDGRVGEHIPAEHLRRRVEQPRFRRGDRVEYNSVTLGGWQPCVVRLVQSDGRLMLECERSGTTLKEFAELGRCRASTTSPPVDRMEAERQRRASTPVRRSSRSRSRSRSHSPDRGGEDGEPEPEPDREPAGFRVGMRIEYNSTRFGWVPGTITRLRRDGTVAVDLDDGRYDGHMDPRYVRVLREGSDKEQEAATAIAKTFRGRQARISVGLQQRSRAFEEIEQRDEGDFLRQSRAASSARAGSAEEMELQGSGRADGKLQRTATADEWSRSADRPPQAPSPDYGGPRPDWPLTEDGVREMIDGFRSEKEPLWLSMVTAILTTVKKRLEEGYGGAVIDIPAPERKGKLVVVGDTHGQLQDFLHILNKQGLPSPRSKTVYVINGDIADRGDKATEIFLIVFALKLVYPEHIFFTRGNHESISMNSDDGCGGFKKEVCTKYNGRTFQLFQQVFDLWPVMAVLDGQIVVCHGGPPRQHVTVDELRELHTRRQPPDEPRGAEDDRFMDIIWLDPHEGNGIKWSRDRGGSHQYGRDHVRRFLRSSGCRMLVRSHQAPPGRDGHMEHHGGQTYTIFSASNYCGSGINRGSVMIFDHEMKHEIDEYYAKSLAEQAQDAREAGRSGARTLRRQASTSELSRQRSDAMDQVILSRLRDGIVKKRGDLEYFFERKDPRRTGLISPAVWREGLTTVLELQHMPLVQYRAMHCSLTDTYSAGFPMLFESSTTLTNSVLAAESTLATLEPDGKINYHRFLQRYVLVTSESGWQDEFIREFYDAIIRQQLPLRDVYALLDPHNTGRVTAAAFRQACQDCGAGIEVTVAQAAELLHDIDSSSTLGVRRSASGGVDLKKFIERLHVVYVSGTGGHPLCDTLNADQVRWVRPLLHRIGRAIAGGASVVDVFEQFDEGRGYLSHRQFVNAIGTVDRGPDGTGTVSPEQLQELAQLVDVDGNGQITIWEFCEAFASAEDAGETGATDADGLRRQFSNAIVRGVAGFVYNNRAILRRTWQDGDPDMDGLVSIDEFRTGLRHANRVLHSPLKRSQLEALVDHAVRRAETEVREGRRRTTMIDYERFLESFDIVDTESGDADAVLATMRARAVPSRRDSGGGGSSPLCRPRRALPEGSPHRSVSWAPSHRRKKITEMVDEVISQLGLDPSMNRSPNEACALARDELGMPSATGIGLNDNLCEIMERLGLPTELDQ